MKKKSSIQLSSFSPSFLSSLLATFQAAYPMVRTQAAKMRLPFPRPVYAARSSKALRPSLSLQQLQHISTVTSIFPARGDLTTARFPDFERGEEKFVQKKKICKLTNWPKQ